MEGNFPPYPGQGGFEGYNSPRMVPPPASYSGQQELPVTKMGFGGLMSEGSTATHPPGFNPPPSAPTENIQSYPGYRDSGFNPTIQPPENPYWNPVVEPSPPPPRSLPPVATISIEEVKEALKNYADSKCCYGSTDKFLIDESDIEMKSAFQYQLISFTEQRETVWKFEPFQNQELEYGYGHPVPGPWSIPASPTALFKDEKRELKIPGTSSMRPCHGCGSMGQSPCKQCLGSGGKNCTWCNGTGKRLDEPCDKCPGSLGREPCTSCKGNGTIVCTTCNGRNALYFYLQLIINWNRREDKFVSDSTLVPEKYLNKASGVKAVEEKGDRVFPISNFPDAAINDSSQNLIKKHATEYGTNGLILKQEQAVDIIRIAKVCYKWKDKSGSFVVYGDSNKVYFPDYPQKCCGCCAII